MDSYQVIEISSSDSEDDVIIIGINNVESGALLIELDSDVEIIYDGPKTRDINAQGNITVEGVTRISVEEPASKGSVPVPLENQGIQSSETQEVRTDTPCSVWELYPSETLNKKEAKKQPKSRKTKKPPKSRKAKKPPAKSRKTKNVESSKTARKNLSQTFEEGQSQEGPSKKEREEPRITNPATQEVRAKPPSENRSGIARTPKKVVTFNENNLVEVFHYQVPEKTWAPKVNAGKRKRSRGAEGK